MLTEKQLFDVYVLQDICEDYDDIELKLNWETLKTRTEQMDFFHYEENRLVGFLGVYKFGEEYEICGMVHPDYRKKGIFTQLLSKALMIIPNNGRILINAPAHSQSAKAWLEKNSCSYSFSENQMKWHKKILTNDTSNIVLREAKEEDLPFLMQVDQLSFGVSDSSNVLTKNGQTYIVEVEKEAVGKIRIERSNEQSWIYRFAILPQYQGKGFGRAALTQVVLKESPICSNIYLEVETKNNNALKLYESCGFVAFHTQDYYDFARQ